MSIDAFALAASEAAGEASEHSQTNPIVYGVFALVVLLGLLVVVTRFNVYR